jgi:hypothetical protein
MTTTTIEPKEAAVGATERALVLGDLAHLSERERIDYYQRVCESLGLNPMTRPFDYLRLNGRLILYARRDATDQLRRLHQIDTEVVSRQQEGDLLIVHVRATMAGSHGRRDEDFGVVSLAGLKGEALANAVMKAVTKAKRRVTLSICGLGWLDETEVEDIQEAEPDPSDLLRQIASATSIEDLDRIAEAIRSGEWRGKARDALRAAWKTARERLLSLK